MDNQSTIRVEHIDEDSTLPKIIQNLPQVLIEISQQEGYYALTFWILEVHNVLLVLLVNWELQKSTFYGQGDCKGGSAHSALGWIW